MAKKYELKHISSTDFSAYGYVGASIERLKVEEVKSRLEGYGNNEDMDSLNKFVSNKSLLDLALDNIERVDDADLGSAFEIINILMNDSGIHKQEVGEYGHSFLSHSIDLLDKYKDNPKIKGFLLDKINALSAEGKDAQEFLMPLMESKDAVKEIGILKRELSDSFLKGSSAESLDKWLIGSMLHEKRLDDIQIIFEENKEALFDGIRQISAEDKKSLLEAYANHPKGSYLIQRELIRSGAQLKEFDYLGKIIKAKFGALLIKDIIASGRMPELLAEKEAPKNLEKIYQLRHGENPNQAYHDLLINMIEAELLRDKLDLELAKKMTLQDFIVDNLEQFKNPISLLHEIAGAQIADASLPVKGPEIVSAKVVSGVDGEPPVQAVAEEVSLPKAKAVSQGSFKLPQKYAEKIYTIAHSAKESDKSEKYKDILLDMYGEELISKDTILESGWLYNTTAENFSKNNDAEIKRRSVSKAKDILQSSAEEEKKTEAAEKVSLSELYGHASPEALAYKIRVLAEGSPEFDALSIDGYSILHPACINGQTGLAKMLIAKGANPFVQGDKGLDAIHILALNNDPSSLEIFQEMKRNKGFSEKMIAAQGNQELGFMYVMLALKSGNIELADELLKPPIQQHALGSPTVDADDISVVNPDHIKRVQSEVFIRAVKSDDAELVRNFFKLASSKEFNPHALRDGPEDFDGVRRALMGSGEAFKAIVEVETIKTSPEQNPTDSMAGSKLNPKVKVSYQTLEEAVINGNVQAVEFILDRIDKFEGMDINLLITEGNQSKNILNTAYSKKVALEDEILFLEQQRFEASGVAEKEKYQASINERKKKVEGLYGTIIKLLEYGVPQPHDSIGSGAGVSMLDVNKALSINLQGYKGEKQNVLTCAYSELAQARQDLKKRSSVPENSLESQEIIKAYGKNWRDDLEKEIGRKEGVVSSILNHSNADITIPDEFGTNLMMLAAQYGDKHCIGISVLRGSGAESSKWIEMVNAKDVRENTALFYAAEAGEIDTFELLISEGAKLRLNGNLIKNNDDINPLMAACGGGHFAVVKSINPDLLDAKVRDKRGNTALHYLAMGSANEENSIKLSNELVDIADIEAKNNEGKTPLILAVINGNLPLVNDLLSKGADINAVDRQGNTPLIYACLLNDKAMIEAVLTENNLDINHENKAGISAFLIASQRDGLESLSADAKGQMIKKLDALHPKIKEAPGLYSTNLYPNLPKILIEKGADPYVSSPVNIIDSMAAVSATIAAAEAARLGSQVVAKSLPIYGGVAGEFIKLGSAFTAAAMVRSTTKKAMKAGIVSYLTDGTEFDKRIDLGDTVMIGSHHDKGIGFIKHGASLKKDVASHNNFQKSDKQPIYTIKDLKEVIEKDRPVSGDTKDMKSLGWYMRAHEDLTSQYISVQKSIENQPWYYTIPLFWKGSALKRVAKDILDADKLLADSKQGREFLKAEYQEPDKDPRNGTFEEAFGAGKGSLVEIMKSPKMSRQLLSAIIKNENKVEGRDPKIDEIAVLVNKVVKKEISVAPDTFYNFVKFADEMKRLNTKEDREVFVRANEPLVSIPDGNKVAVESFSKQRKKCADEAKPLVPQTSEVEVRPPATFIKGLQWITGAKDPYKARNDVAGAVGEVTGSAAGAYAAAQLNPEVKGAMIKLGESVSAVAGQGVSIASTTLGVASANLVLTGLALAGAGIWYNWNRISKAIGSVFNPLHSSAEVSKAPTEAKDIKSACAKNVDTKTLSNLNPATLKREVKFDIVDKHHPDNEKLHGVVESHTRGAAEVGHSHSSAMASNTSGKDSHRADIKGASAFLLADKVMDKTFDNLLDGYDEKDKEDIKHKIKEVEEALIKSGVSRAEADDIIIRELDRDMKEYDKFKVTPEDKHTHALKEKRKLSNLVEHHIIKGG